METFNDSPHNVFSTIGFSCAQIKLIQSVVPELGVVFCKTRVPFMKLEQLCLRTDVHCALIMQIDRNFCGPKAKFSFTGTLLWQTAFFFANSVKEIFRLQQKMKRILFSPLPIWLIPEHLVLQLKRFCKVIGSSIPAFQKHPIGVQVVEVVRRFHLTKLATKSEPISENYKSRTFAAMFNANCSTFKWQKHNSYHKVLRFVVFHRVVEVWWYLNAKLSDIWSKTSNNCREEIVLPNTVQTLCRNVEKAWKKPPSASLQSYLIFSVSLDPSVWKGQLSELSRLNKLPLM